MFGVPVRAPVVVLKLIPGGVALMLKLAIAPPVELEVKPVAAVFTVRVSDDEDKVNAGAVKRDVITRLVPLELTATNVPTPLTVPYVTDCQLLFAAALRAVQLVPLVLVITRLSIVPEVLSLTATNTPLPYVTERHLFSPPIAVRGVQVFPSGLVNTLLVGWVSSTTTNWLLP